MGSKSLTQPASVPTNAGSPLKGFGALLAANVAGRVLGSIRMLAFAPLMGPEAFGVLRLATTCSTILAAFSGLGLHTCHLRFLPEAASPAEAASVFRRTLAISVGACLLITAAMAPFLPRLARAIFSEEGHTLLMGMVLASLVATVLFRSMLGTLQGIGRFDRAGIADTLQSLIFSVCGIGLLMLIPGSANGAFAVYTASMVIAASWAWAVLPLRHERPLRNAHSTDLTRRALIYSASYAVIPLFTYLFDFIDRWMLARFDSLKAAGTYSIVPVLTGGLLLLSPPLAAVALRHAAASRATGHREVGHRFIWGCMSLCSIASMVYAAATLLAAPLVWKLAGREWAEAAPVLPIFLVYHTTYNSFYLLGCFAAVEERTWIHLIAGAVGTATTVVLNYLWIPNHGMMGAGAGTLVGLLAMTSVHLTFVLSRGIAVPARVWLALALPAVLLLPLPICLPLLAGIVVAGMKTRLLLRDSDRRMAAAWMGRNLRKLGRAATR